MELAYNRLSNLFKKYISQTINDEDKVEFFDYVQDPIYSLKIKELISEAYENQEELAELNEQIKIDALNFILGEEQHADSPKRIKLWPYISIAAALLIVVSTFMFNRMQNQNATENDLLLNLSNNNILPGTNKAYLTLANGKVIQLNNTKTGVVIDASKLRYNDGTFITDLNLDAVDRKTNTGNNKGNGENLNDKSLTASTPIGGTYQIILSDGTHIWLNASSSIKFPETFAGLKERRIELIGEGYFEVAKDKKHPFIVKTANQEVQVLGTHFNINSYPDETTIKTTLLEGSVRLNGKTMLKPGEESTLTQAGTFSIEKVDANTAVAWKNGEFVFKSERIESIMRKLARWYNIEVVYKGNFNEQTFTGSINRDDNIAKILTKITFTEAVHFKIEGRRITVME